MHQSVQAIYLKHFSYSESSIVLKVFTKQYGLQAFLVKGVKKKKGGMALLQPFHVLDITTNFNPNKDLNYAGDIKLHQSTSSITLDIRKSTVAIFLTEILYKSIKEQEGNPELYNFLSTSISLFEESDFELNFHLLFLMELSKYFGFQPSVPDRNSLKYFNLKEGVSEHPVKITEDHLTHELSESFLELLGVKYTQACQLNISNSIRKKLLKILVQYYELQLGLKKGAITSHKILELVFDD